VDGHGNRQEEVAMSVTPKPPPRRTIAGRRKQDIMDAYARRKMISMLSEINGMTLLIPRLVADVVHGCSIKERVQWAGKALAVARNLKEFAVAISEGKAKNVNASKNTQADYD
jgi:hypothetical protein